MQCPAGLLHSWAAMVSARSNGSGCPQCRGRKVCKHNSLATVAPAVAAEWHLSKNTNSPDAVTAFSTKSAWWQCSVCSHEWSAAIRTRTVGSGCPVCAKGKRAQRQRRPTFAACNHPLLAEWDHQRNAQHGMYPDKITLGSNKKIFWLCSKCPAGQEHNFPATGYDRTGKRASGCTVCAGWKACKCNSLQTQYPDLALDWDYARNVNKASPNDCSASSTYIALSAEGRRWQQRIDRRTVLLASVHGH